MAAYNVYELPFSARPQYITIRLVGTEYRFKLSWNIPANCWVIDITSMNGGPLACGIPLVTGCDLLGQFDYLEIGGQLFVVTDQTATGGVVPTFDDLGITGHVFFLPDGSKPL